MLTTQGTNQLYEIRFENRPGYLLAKIKGKSASLEASRKYWAEIVAQATRVKPERVIIWEDFSDMLSIMDTYLLLKELCQLKQFLKTRIAFVDEHQDQLVRNKVGELIAANSGFTCRVFTHFEEAEKWVMQK